MVCTRKIKECTERLTNPTIKSVIKELNWTPDCATCAKNIIKEITIQLEKR